MNTTRPLYTTRASLTSVQARHGGYVTSKAMDARIENESHVKEDSMDKVPLLNAFLVLACPNGTTLGRAKICVRGELYPAKIVLETSVPGFPNHVRT